MSAHCRDAKGDKGELSAKTLLEAQARDEDMRVLAAKLGKFKGFRLHGMRPPTVCRLLVVG